MAEHAAEAVERIFDAIETEGLHPIWIALADRGAAIQRARDVDPSLPLAGMPFAVKDNIDVAGMPTTAGCPAYAYVPERTAPVVQRLIDAGAILIGKTNLDQFATGLVGVRSPYGACSSVFDKRYISGGSSSGSAVAVAKGLVAFALGTDTAGSGRVPAAFNDIVGLKPTRGLLSAAGVVPACRSLDCVSIFAGSAAGAQRVWRVAQGFDAADPFSRTAEPGADAAPWLPGPFRFGVPRDEELAFFGDTESPRLYRTAMARLEALGGTRVTIDFAPFRDAAALLYRAVGGRALRGRRRVRGRAPRGGAPGGGADRARGGLEVRGGRLSRSVSSRGAEARGRGAVGRHRRDAAADGRDDLHEGGRRGRSDSAEHQSRLLHELREPDGSRGGGDAGGIPSRRSAVRRVAHRSRVLGRGAAGAGVALRGHSDRGDRRRAGMHSRGRRRRASHRSAAQSPAHRAGRAARAVVPHVAEYRFYALANTTPPKPGLVREPGFEGPGIALEIWAVPSHHFGSFVAGVPPPLGIGSVQLDTGEWVKGFICEPAAIAGATEITAFGGWKNYLASYVAAGL